MCGICGVIGRPDGPAVERMVSAMHHRGPDDRGVHVFEHGAIGMSRLSILDLSDAAHQPMSSDGGALWIVYNGEVYNYREERNILEKKGYSFCSSSDTEVVLRMYEHYGDDFLLRLRGMFALAIHDSRRGSGREKVLVARDQLGVKPLLYARSGGVVVFASELKALLASGLVSRDIDPESLRLLLSFGSVKQPRTMLRGVQMLLPGHRMIIEAGRQNIERYWSLGVDRYSGLRNAEYPEQVAALSGVLSKALRQQMVSDVPLGAFLSGGVDSSILVAMMAREAGSRVKTYSVGFEQEGAHIDESGRARMTASYLGTDHTHVLVTGEDVRARIESMASSLDQPSVDGINSYFVSLAARQGVKVAISGTGADELFAGYPSFMGMAAYELERKTSGLMHGLEGIRNAVLHNPVLDPVMRGKRWWRLNAARKSSGFLARYAKWYQIFDDIGAAHLLHPDLRQQANAGRSVTFDLAGMDELSWRPALERVTGLCLRGYATNQLLRDIDAMSMCNSLEVRVPFLDQSVVDIALSLPDGSKLGPARPEMTAGTTYRESGAKRILIDVGRPLLPPDFDCQPKSGFGMPFDFWLRGPLQEVMNDTLGDQQVRRRGLLDPEEVGRVRERFRHGSVGWTHPWLLMILELWCRNVRETSNA
jgi:asparagine synthase (glutamine-hydrolysing)